MPKIGAEALMRDLEPLAVYFKLLSDGTRLRILNALAEGERNVTSLCEELGLLQPTVSHHLGLLRLKHLITSRRNGKQVFYALNGRLKMSDGNKILLRTEEHTVEIAPRDPHF